MITTTTAALVAVIVGLLSYLSIRWLKDPLRKIPGPVSLPLIGNVHLLDPTKMHVQMYEWAEKYGPVMKFSIFNKPYVVLNSLEGCLEAKHHRGEDFLGRPHFPRYSHILKSDLGFTCYEDPAYHTMRHVATSGLRAYGPGVADLEKVMQEVLQDTIEDLNHKSGQPISSSDLCYRFVGKIISFLLYGERDTVDEEIFQKTREMNDRTLQCLHPVTNHPILDVFPVLMKLMPLIFRGTHEFLEDTKHLIESHMYKQIKEAKEAFDERHMRGVLDHFIQAQREELDVDGKPLLSDEALLGLLFNFIVAGMETIDSSLKQAFLDIVHDQPLVKRMQAQIDANFEAAEVIKLSDREKLPLLEAYVNENVRVLSQCPMLLPCRTICDTEAAGYKIPRDTQVLINAFHTAHNPKVYPEPFVCKPERFLDTEGNLVPPNHPVRQNFIGFGVGKRHCPGESFGRTRIFLFLAHILQKFDIEPVGEIPERDVRKYEMGLVLNPPSVDVKFTLRHHV